METVEMEGGFYLAFDLHRALLVSKELDPDCPGWVRVHLIRQVQEGVLMARDKGHG